MKREVMLKMIFGCVFLVVQLSLKLDSGVEPQLCLLVHGGFCLPVRRAAQHLNDEATSPVNLGGLGFHTSALIGHPQMSRTLTFPVRRPVPLLGMCLLIGSWVLKWQHRLLPSHQLFSALVSSFLCPSFAGFPSSPRTNSFQSFFRSSFPLLSWISLSLFWLCYMILPFPNVLPLLKETVVLR